MTKGEIFLDFRENFCKKQILQKYYKNIKFILHWPKMLQSKTIYGIILLYRCKQKNINRRPGTVRR